MSVEPDPVRTTLRNDTAGPFTVWIEPWGEDYTLLPGEEFDLYVPGLRRASQVHGNGFALFYVEACVGEHRFWLEQDGRRIECGHNRQSGDESR